MAAPPELIAAEEADQVPGEVPVSSSPPFDPDEDRSYLCRVKPLPTDMREDERFAAWHRIEVQIAMDRDEFMERLRFSMMTARQRDALWAKAIGALPKRLAAPAMAALEARGRAVKMPCGPNGERPTGMPDLCLPCYQTKKKVAPQWTGPVLRAIQRTGQVQDSLRAAGVDEDDYFFWKAKDKDFARAVDRAFIESATLIEGKLHEIAAVGELQGIYYKGRKVGAERKVSVAAAKIMLEGLKPERYVEPAALVEASREAAAGQGRGGLTMNITINALGGAVPPNLPRAIDVRSIPPRGLGVAAEPWQDPQDEEEA